MTDNQQARRQVENANAALMFALPLVDPMTNPPGRPIHPWAMTDNYRRHLDATNDQAREVEAPDDDEQPVLFVRRKHERGAA